MVRLPALNPGRDRPDRRRDPTLIDARYREVGGHGRSPANPIRRPHVVEGRAQWYQGPAVAWRVEVAAEDGERCLLRPHGVRNEPSQSPELSKGPGRAAPGQ